MSDLGPLFATPEPDHAPAPEWTELAWTNGYTYRWRLHRSRFTDGPPEEWKHAPDQCRWELERFFHDEWREVRNGRRRDEIWTVVRRDFVVAKEGES